MSQIKVMAFAFFNKTKRIPFMGRFNLSGFMVDVAIGFVEEITLNVTNIAPNQVVMNTIQDSITDIPVISRFKDYPLIIITSSLTSSTIRTKTIEIISAATFNII